MMSGMDTLGWLAWWTFPGDVRLDREVGKVMEEVGMDMISAPKEPVPSDAFRKIASVHKEYALPDDATATLELFPVESSDAMLVRHIVRTVRRGKVVVDTARVGEAAFYRPPRGRPKKARMRIQVNRTDDEHIEQYAEELRQEYQRRLGTFDGQAARRLARAYLTHVDALWVDGVYVVSEEHHGDVLHAFVTRLGGHCWVVPLPDTPATADMLTYWKEHRA